MEICNKKKENQIPCPLWERFEDHQSNGQQNMIDRYERSKSRKTEILFETLWAYTLIIRNINYGKTEIINMIRNQIENKKTVEIKWSMTLDYNVFNQKEVWIPHKFYSFQQHSEPRKSK